MDSRTEADFGHRIALLERKVSNLYEILQRAEPEFDNTNCSDEVVALVQAGNTIQAVQLHRQQTGCGLAEARDAVERVGITRRTPRGPGYGPSRLIFQPSPSRS